MSKHLRSLLIYKCNAGIAMSWDSMCLMDVSNHSTCSINKPVQCVCRGTGILHQLQYATCAHRIDSIIRKWYANDGCVCILLQLMAISTFFYILLPAARRVYIMQHIPYVFSNAERKRAENDLSLSYVKIN